MAKFLATINSEDPLVRGLAKGIDLSTLGLSLNSAEYDGLPKHSTESPLTNNTIDHFTKHGEDRSQSPDRDR